MSTENRSDRRERIARDLLTAIDAGEKQEQRWNEIMRRWTKVAILLGAVTIINASIMVIGLTQ